MTIPVGSVTIDDDGTEHTTPGLGTDLYFQRKATTKLPDPDHKKGCTVAVTAPVSTNTVQVDDSAGYVIGDFLGSFVYLGPGNVAATVQLYVTSKPDSTHVTVSPTLPADLPSGTMFGFQGTSLEWHNLVLPKNVAIRRQIASAAIGDGTAISADVSSGGFGILQGARQIIVATAGQTVFALTLFSYVVGQNTLAVYLQGVRQYPDAYVETNPTTVTFTSPLSAGDSVMFELLQIVAGG